MTELMRYKLDTRTTQSRSFSEFLNCIEDLIEDEKIESLNDFTQHGSVTCFDHSLSVSYYSYGVCRLLRLDYRSAARGGLLHDLFLYDWHKSKLIGGLHGFTHPYTALENAKKSFQLNKMEKDIIVKHMWPLTILLPKYKESFVVSFVDKYVALIEIGKFFKKKVAAFRNTSLSGI